MDVVNESIDRISVLKGLENFFQGIGGRDEFAFIKAYPLAAEGLRILLEPLV